MQNGLFRRSLSAFVLAGLMCASVLGAHAAIADKAAITFQEVGDTYLGSFGLVESDKQAVSTADTNSTKIDLCPPVLTDHEKRQLLFGLMAGSDAVSNQLPSPMDDALRITLKDLDIFYGSGYDTKKTFVNEIDNTSTVFGQVLLAYSLAHPFADVQKIKNRQDIIKRLVEDQDLCDTLETILAQVRSAESGFFSYWRQSDPVSEKFFKKMYFSSQGLNTSSVALEAYTRLGNLGTAWKIGGDLVLLVGANYVMSKIAALSARAAGATDPNGNPIQIDDTLKGACKATLDTAKSFFDPRGYVHAIKGVDEAAAQFADAMEKNGSPMTDAGIARTKKFMYGAIALKGLAATAYAAHLGYKTKTALAEAAQVKNGINYLQSRLIDVASIVDACKKMRAVVSKNPEMEAGLVYAQELDAFFDAHASDPFNQLIQLMQTNTFKNAPSFFSLSGRVLAAHKLMETEKEHFAPALAALGEIDACLSVAKLYKKMKNERVGYCFVDFVSAERPVLQIDDFWNPFVNKQVVVTNSLSMGSQGSPSKIILTGSNTGGKSTILKALMMSLLFGHTFGLAPASKMTATPFAFIGSYLRVNDDTALGESKFKAEVMRAKMLCDTMINLPKDQFGFIVIDELFTGTGSEKAASAAYKVAQKLAALDNNLYILATHFPLLTGLQDESAGQIMNYKVDVYKNEAGALVRPFKLEPGVSSSNIANDILNEQISDINFDL